MIPFEFFDGSAGVRIKNSGWLYLSIAEIGERPLNRCHPFWMAQ
mgnify:CR=1 FL=1